MSVETNEPIHLKWLNETGLNELELVGGKNASLGEMIQNLHTLVKVPGGFVITAVAFKKFLQHNNLDKDV